MEILKTFAFVAVFAVCATAPVYAEEVKLFCHRAGSAEGDGLNVKVDLSASTATAWSTGSPVRNDTQSAVITADEIKWTWGTATMTLERSTGALTEWWNYSAVGGSASFLCKKVSPVL